MNHVALGALIARDEASIEKEMALLERALAISAHDMRALSPVLDDVRWIAIASMIEKAYMGWERVMKRIAVDVDGYCPQGGLLAPGSGGANGYGCR
ncbi:hypothetical protein [Acidiferrobacter sp.]|uniref:hypothetical protein n=1 Tax=Acidiferrobacter sp. TaxID=1872107 RepID=UPI00260FEDC2|nr:hypothetical protein [Acidiferrobacter sp.]